MSSTIAIMQPYFMPYLGYFSLINYVDEFILFDTPQFIRHGWIERNKVLKLDGDTMYIKAPLIKHSRETCIKDVVINNEIDWKSKVFAQLIHYKKKAPFYKVVIDLLNEIFEFEYSSIVDLNFKSLKVINKYLEITTPITLWSESNTQIEKANAPDEWALNICKALGIKTYINPPGGKEFFDQKKYEDAGIDLKFLELEKSIYKQFNEDFVSHLSIIDVIMFNERDEIKKMMGRFKLV